MMVKQGDSDTVDAIRAEILKHPQIHIADAPQFYDIEVFNQCEQSQNLMVTIECWKDVHPALVTLPVDWDHPIPYGILYAKEPDADVTHFIKTVKKHMKKTCDQIPPKFQKRENFIQILLILLGNYV